MKTFSRMVLLWGTVLAFGLLAQAATVEGTLVDKMCSAKVLKEGQKAAAMHTRECALMPDCQKSGYGVLTSDNRYITLDDAGNQQVIKTLEGSKKKSNLRVRVTGDVEGDSIKVQSVKLI